MKRKSTAEKETTYALEFEFSSRPNEITWIPLSLTSLSINECAPRDLIKLAKSLTKLFKRKFRVIETCVTTRALELK
jgi:hypothetical protein